YWPARSSRDRRCRRRRDKKGGRAHNEGMRLPVNLVGVAGFEPTASSSRTKRATKLRYTPCTARLANFGWAASAQPEQHSEGRQPLHAGWIGWATGATGTA